MIESDAFENNHDDMERPAVNGSPTTEGVNGSLSPTTEALSTISTAPYTNNTSTTAEDKVKVHFVAVGSAPIMKKTKFLIGASNRFSSVIAFLRKMLKLTDSGSSLFLYCNSAFAPGQDELVGDLRDCFAIRGELVINYSFQVSGTCVILSCFGQK